MNNQEQDRSGRNWRAERLLTAIDVIGAYDALSAVKLLDEWHVTGPDGAFSRSESLADALIALHEQIVSKSEVQL